MVSPVPLFLPDPPLLLSISNNHYPREGPLLLAAFLFPAYPLSLVHLSPLRALLEAATNLQQKTHSLSGVEGGREEVFLLLFELKRAFPAALLILRALQVSSSSFSFLRLSLSPCPFSSFLPFFLTLVPFFSPSLTHSVRGSSNPPGGRGGLSGSDKPVSRFLSPTGSTNTFGSQSYDPDADNDFTPEESFGSRSFDPAQDPSRASLEQEEESYDSFDTFQTSELSLPPTRGSLPRSTPPSRSVPPPSSPSQRVGGGGGRGGAGGRGGPSTPTRGGSMSVGGRGGRGGSPAPAPAPGPAPAPSGQGNTSGRGVGVRMMSPAVQVTYEEEYFEDEYGEEYYYYDEEYGEEYGEEYYEEEYFIGEDGEEYYYEEEDGYFYYYEEEGAAEDVLADPDAWDVETDSWRTRARSLHKEKFGSDTFAVDDSEFSFQ